MITNEEILELVRFHFEEGGVRDNGSCSEYYGTIKDFIDFARAMYEKGDENGWESHKQVEYFNSPSQEDWEDIQTAIERKDSVPIPTTLEELAQEMRPTQEDNNE